MEKPKILVVGSMNMDLFVEGANSIPGFGESIMCGNYGYATGGKGSNQQLFRERMLRWWDGSAKIQTGSP